MCLSLASPTFFTDRCIVSLMKNGKRDDKPIGQGHAFFSIMGQVTCQQATLTRKGGKVSFCARARVWVWVSVWVCGCVPMCVCVCVCVCVCQCVCVPVCVCVCVCVCV